MQIIGKSFTISEFQKYVSELQFNGWTPQFVVVHNTSVPTQDLYKSWHDKSNWNGEQWMKNLASYYSGMGWNGGPHLFVGYDKIWVFNPLTIHGTHTPSWNKFTWGVETIAEFDKEPFENGVKDNLIAALGILHSRIGLNPLDYKLGVRGLHFHKEDWGTTHKDCPGKNLIKTQLINAVVDYMNLDQKDISTVHPHISEASQTANTTKLSNDELTSIFWLQKELNSHGFHLTVDGIVGKNTTQSVKEFQSKNRLVSDGIAGPLTRLALKGI